MKTRFSYLILLVTFFFLQPDYSWYASNQAVLPLRHPDYPRFYAGGTLGFWRGKMFEVSSTTSGFSDRGNVAAGLQTGYFVNNYIRTGISARILAYRRLFQYGGLDPSMLSFTADLIFDMRGCNRGLATCYNKSKWSPFVGVAVGVNMRASVFRSDADGTSQESKAGQYNAGVWGPIVGLTYLSSSESNLALDVRYMRSNKSYASGYLTNAGDVDPHYGNLGPIGRWEVMFSYTAYLS